MKKLLVVCVILLGCIGNRVVLAQISKTCTCEINEKAAKDEFNAYFDKKQEKKAKHLAYKLIRNKNPSCKALGCDFLVSLFHRTGEMDSAMVYLQLAEKSLKNLSCNKKAVMEFHSSKSIHHFMTNDMESGIKESMLALKLALELNDYRNQAYLYSNLSLSFYQLNQYEKGRLYAQSLMSVIPKLSDPYVKIDMQRYIAESYYNYYKGTSNKSVLDSINLFANIALDASKKIGYNETVVTCYILKHHKPYILKNFNESLLYLDSALTLLQTGKVYNAVQSSYRINLLKADIYLESKQAPLALKAADSSFKYAALMDFNGYKVSSYDRLYKANKMAGDLNKSIFYLEKYMSLKDSVQNLERTSIVNELEQKYNKVQNEKTIKEQAHKNNLLLKQKEIDGLQIRFLWVGVALIMLVFLVIVFFFRQRNFKQKQQLVETEQRLNRSRINPHFFFNILGSLQKIVLSNEDKRSSVLHLARFSKIMRQTLESSYNDNVSIAQEVDFLKEYLELQKLRKNNQFEFSIEVESEIDPEEFYVPSMLLQPFIENSLEHGFSEMTEHGFIRINFIHAAGELVVSIEDNGKGVQTGLPKQSSHISRATQIIQDRLSLLNKQYKAKARFELKSGENNQGTLVVVYIPDGLESNLRGSRVSK